MESIDNNDNNTKTAVIKGLYVLLQLRHQMKIYHWQTKAYARHKASDELVEELDELTDKYIEAYSGIYDNIHLDYPINIQLNNTCDKSISSYLKANRKVINELLDNVKDTELLNLRDEILQVIDKTIYLFKFTQ